MTDNIWKHPPIAKVYEALTAVADGRVVLVAAGRAEVSSSDGTKSYSVTWTEDRTAFGSNDNASYWQGYLGYPIVATLLHLGVVEYSPDVARLLSGIAWKKLNDAAKRDYDAVIADVLRNMPSDSAESVKAEARRIHEGLKSLELTRLRADSAPPKAVGR